MSNFERLWNGLCENNWCLSIASKMWVFNDCFWIDCFLYLWFRCYSYCWTCWRKTWPITNVLQKLFGRNVVKQTAFDCVPMHFHWNLRISHWTGSTYCGLWGQKTFRKKFWQCRSCYFLCFWSKWWEHLPGNFAVLFSPQLIVFCFCTHVYCYLCS